MSKFAWARKLSVMNNQFQIDSEMANIIGSKI